MSSKYQTNSNNYQSSVIAPESLDSEALPNETLYSQFDKACNTSRKIEESLEEYYDNGSEVDLSVRDEFVRDRKLFTESVHGLLTCDTTLDVFLEVSGYEPTDTFLDISTGTVWTMREALKARAEDYQKRSTSVITLMRSDSNLSELIEELDPNATDLQTLGTEQSEEFSSGVSTLEPDSDSTNPSMFLHDARKLAFSSAAPDQLLHDQITEWRSTRETATQETLSTDPSSEEGSWDSNTLSSDTTTEFASDRLTSRNISVPEGSWTPGTTTPSVSTSLVSSNA